MCGRYSLISDADALAEEFGFFNVDAFELSPRYNIAPTQTVPIVRMDESHDQPLIEPCHWGLIPSWAKDAAIGNRMINARLETADSKPAYRAAFRRRRCLVPCSGFYEWRKVDGGKQPHLIGLVDRSLFALAGLWERWIDPGGSEVHSFTILTTAANAFMERLHDRMPVFVGREHYDAWLDPDLQEVSRIKRLLPELPADAMTAHPVDKRVNSPRFDDPSCIANYVSPKDGNANDADRSGFESQGDNLWSLRGDS